MSRIINFPVFYKKYDIQKYTKPKIMFLLLWLTSDCNFRNFLLFLCFFLNYN